MFNKMLYITIAIISFGILAQDKPEAYQISYVQDLPSEYAVFDHSRSREVHIISFEIPWFHGNYKQENCSISYGKSQRGGTMSATSCEALKLVLNDFIKKFNLTKDNFIPVDSKYGGYEYKTDLPLILKTNFIGSSDGLREIAFMMNHQNYKNNFNKEKAIARIARVLSAMKNPRFDDVFPYHLGKIVEELFNDDDLLYKINHHPNFKRGLWDDLKIREATEEEIKKHGHYVLGRAKYLVLGTDDDVDRLIIFGPYREPFQVFYPEMD